MMKAKPNGKLCWLCEKCGRIFKTQRQCCGAWLRRAKVVR